MNLFLLIFLFFSIVVSIIPIVLIARFFYNKDTVKEPKKLLRELFAAGVLSGLIVLIISIIGISFFPSIADLSKIDNILSLMFYSYIFIALIEESFKLFMIYNGSYYNEDFNQAFDIVLYSVYVGLGFACFENIVYMLNNPSITIAILRGITAVPSHVCFQVIMGYFLYLSKSSNKKSNIFKGLIISILLHGTYDLFIFSGSIILAICDLILLLIMIFNANLKIKKLIEIDKKSLITFCPNCDTQINYEYCPKCGHKKNNN